MVAPDQPPSPVEQFVPLESTAARPAEQSSPVEGWGNLDLSATPAGVVTSSPSTATVSPEVDAAPPPPIIVWGALPVRGEATESVQSDSPGKQTERVGRWGGFRPVPRAFPDAADETLELWQPGPMADPPSLPYFFISLVVALLTGAGAVITGSGSDLRNQIQLALTILFSG